MCLRRRHRNPHQHETLTAANICDQDIDTQALTAQRALRELARIHQVTVTTGQRTIDLTTRGSPLQAAIAKVLDIDTTTWATTTIT